MPGWHASTEELQRAGSLQNIGIIQEQHPSRARLFMQWQRMEWPVMVDSLNLLGLKVVPVTYLIDESGTIQYRGGLEGLEDFLARDRPDQTPQPVPAERPRLPEAADRSIEAADLRFLWGDDDALDVAIDGYRARLTDADADLGQVHFRLGVSLRRRADGPRRQDGDFAAAVEHWGHAIENDPNQYIWRRRIQQYGPRLEKPYSFYDWVSQARLDIKSRGEVPAALDVEPRGAELAQPSRSFTVGDAAVEPPLGAYRIYRDEKGLILLEHTLVPRRVTPGSAARVHLTFRPNVSIKGHWNNEADDLEVWVEAPDGWQVDRRRLSVSNPPELVSDEARRLELEVRSPIDASPADAVELRGFALYYVCEDVGGTCLYRRQDFTVALPVVETGP
ncbi:MAG: hypothetical protein AAGM22_14260 [Acidobacteriota bacterium]